jgi:hypothetical protein
VATLLRRRLDVATMDIESAGALVVGGAFGLGEASGERGVCVNTASIAAFDERLVANGMLHREVIRLDGALRMAPR